MLISAGAQKKAFLDFSLPVLSNIAAAVSGEARAFKVGVKGRVGRGVSPPAGARGLCLWKNFQVTDACRRVLAHFSYKNQHIDACIYACKLW
jgi:hypothetical protein